MQFINLSSALLVFFAAGLYLFCGARFRWIFLLFLSLILWCMASWSGLVLAILQTLMGYAMGLWLERRRNVFTFWTFVILQLIPLVIYKLKFAEGWLTPLGLSYYSFQILSYLIEIQWGRLVAERNLARFASYILFFANKTAGPIERPSLLTQMTSIETPNGHDLFKNALYIWLGFFQKFVLADQLNEYVKPVFDAPQNYSGITTTVAVLLSKYQIFCDFSGISLIALGVAGLFGLKITKNFNRPFASSSLREFWTRWHISLQTWIRDYVFFPTLSTPLARFGVFLPLLVTFVVFGLWHGLRWNFVLYGVLQAVLLVIEPTKILMRWRYFAIVFNYIFLICLPSVLFRTATFDQAALVWTNMGLSLSNWSYFTELSSFKLPTLLMFIVLCEVIQWLDARHSLFDLAARLPWLTKMSLSVFLLIILILYSKFDPQTVFIYSEF